MSGLRRQEPNPSSDDSGAGSNAYPWFPRSDALWSNISYASIILAP